MDSERRTIQVRDLPDHVHELFMQKYNAFKSFFILESTGEMDLAMNAMCSSLAVIAFEYCKDPEGFLLSIFDLTLSNLGTMREDLEDDEREQEAS